MAETARAVGAMPAAAPAAAAAAAEGVGAAAIGTALGSSVTFVVSNSDGVPVDCLRAPETGRASPSPNDGVRSLREGEVEMWAWRVPSESRRGDGEGGGTPAAGGDGGGRPKAAEGDGEGGTPPTAEGRPPFLVERGALLGVPERRSPTTSFSMAENAGGGVGDAGAGEEAGSGEGDAGAASASGVAFLGVALVPENKITMVRDRCHDYTKDCKFKNGGESELQLKLRVCRKRINMLERYSIPRYASFTG